MPYVTVFRPPRVHQISFDEIIRGEVAVSSSAFNTGPVTDTITRWYDTVGADLVRKFDIPSIITRLEAFNNAHAALFEAERQSLYRSFCIPKRSGGVRNIDAPNDQLMEALRQLKSLFESFCGALYHTSAFAYIQHRSTIDCVKRHQGNASRWFLKVDFSNFFGSTTEEFLCRQLMLIFPFSEILFHHRGNPALKKALSLCFLNGGLPQGTPISPMLTNLMMIPIDFELANRFKKKGFIYTRYADDIIISSKYSFMFTEVIQEVNEVLNKHHAPFCIKKEKTRYGSSNGSNWNLGVMLNSDNEITIGWRRKKQIRAMTNSYVLDKRNGTPWPYEDIASYSGLLSYCKMVEPSFFAQLIRQSNEKYSINLMEMIKHDLNGGAH